MTIIVEVVALALLRDSILRPSKACSERAPLVEDKSAWAYADAAPASIICGAGIVVVAGNSIFDWRKHMAVAFQARRIAGCRVTLITRGRAVLLAPALTRTGLASLAHMTCVSIVASSSVSHGLWNAGVDFVIAYTGVALI